ncbi:MAG: UDP binding domain-containing protein [Solirubrobacteraceae bacterium]
MERSGVGDIRESPALQIIEVLGERGAVLSSHDSYVPEVREHGLHSTSLDDLLGADPDAVGRDDTVQSVAAPGA